LVIKRKQVLITAGPTWVAIDNVRVISNIATAQTGLLLAERFNRLGAKVTLILGPVQLCCLDKKIKTLRFQFFEDLQGILARELKLKKYDIVIHSAAVSDYRPKLSYKQKVGSGKKSWKINLIPTPKLINTIKKIQKDAFLVGFKFIPQSRREILLKASRQLLKQANADLIVANTIDKKGYSAYVVDKSATKGPVFSKEALVEKLSQEILKNDDRT